MLQVISLASFRRLMAVNVQKRSRFVQPEGIEPSFSLFKREEQNPMFAMTAF